MGLVISLGLLLIVLFSAVNITPARADDDKWYYRYYANKTLSGDPVKTGHESNIDHIWGNGSPGDEVPNNNFSAKWTRRVHFDAGVYRFVATMDDGMRVWVNDNEIISSWNDSQVHTVVTDIYIPAGDHNLKVEYYEATGGAIAQFSWGLAGATTNPSVWLGQYFNNKELVGQPSAVRNDAAINFDWGMGRPVDGINADDFAVRWTRTLNLPPGIYRFTTTTDDGVRLWVNNQLVIDKWQPQTVTSHTADVEVAGDTAIKMEYFDDRDSAVARLDYAKIADSSSVNLFPPASGLSGWNGTYYNNTNLDDASVMVRLDPEINFIWGSSSPQPNVVNADRFSVRWTNNHDFPAGRYRFNTFADGGVRLWVNNQLIIDEWQDPYKTVEHANVIELPGGSVPLRLEFFDDVGLAEMRLEVVAENGTGTAVTTSSSTGVSSSTTPTLAPMTAEVINARVLNVRSGPSMADEPFTHVSGGQVVALTGCRNAGWIEIQLPDGTTGWVGGSYLAGNFSYSSLETCVSGGE
jgi:hypothetical protein